jgi:2-isopropylmalate synthase
MNRTSFKQVTIYDTTLRDGSQAEDISFSVEDKIRIARRLDDLGIQYIEGGWPGSNPRDQQFFKEASQYPFKNAKIVPFGSTARPGNAPEKDHNLRSLTTCKTHAVTIFGKAWDVHVREALRIDLRNNLVLILQSLKFLKRHFHEVFFDAEHFFDGYKANPAYALEVLRKAQAAEVDCIILCDTNGGTLCHDLQEIIREVKKKIHIPLGIHTHNDGDLAVANSILSVQLGISQVQGTINGLGERCGNADLCSIIPNLKLKLNIDCIPSQNLKKLFDVSHFVYELANMQPLKHQPFVGNSAFAHKAGIHVSAIKRNPETYEHIKPEQVGNVQRVLISDLAGKSNILYKAKEYGMDVDSKDPAVQDILNNLKELEHRGYQFEGAEASFEILMNKALRTQKRYFHLVGFRVINEKRQDEQPVCEATIMVDVGGKPEHTAALGNGPVNALDNALRKALEKFYPQIKETELIDYKVRVLDSGQGTASKVRVLIETGDKKDKWGTVGVSENIIEASWQALVDSINYKLYKDEKIGTSSRKKNIFTD